VAQVRPTLGCCCCCCCCFGAGNCFGGRCCRRSKAYRVEELRRPEGDEGSAELGLHKRPALAAHTPPERNRRGRPHPPPWRLLALVAFGSFGGLAAFGGHIVYRLSAGRSPVPGARDEHDELRLREVSPATCPGRTLLAVARCIARSCLPPACVRQ
jgi:hypothetical protein